MCASSLCRTYFKHVLTGVLLKWLLYLQRVLFNNILNKYDI